MARTGRVKKKPVRRRNHEIVGIRRVRPNRVIELKVIGSLIAGGMNNPADDHFKPAVNLNDIIIANPVATYMGYAWSDSMEPLIYEGAILIVDKTKEIRNGNYIAGTFENSWFMKRFWREPDGRIFLHSENPKYKPVEVLEGLQFKIFGRITQVIQSL